MPIQKELSDCAAYSGDIIEVLKAQHRDMKSRLKDISDYLKNKELDFADISERLLKFNGELADHADFENCAFYQPLLKKIEGWGFDFDTDDLKEFIAEITKTLNTINDFVQKYKEAEAIQKNIPAFSSDLSAVMVVLETRIVAEEEGVFIYW